MCFLFNSSEQACLPADTVKGLSLYCETLSEEVIPFRTFMEESSVYIMPLLVLMALFLESYDFWVALLLLSKLIEHEGILEVTISLCMTESAKFTS